MPPRGGGWGAGAEAPVSRRLSSVPSWKPHPALGKSPWRCAWGTRDGVSLPAQSATEHAGQNEGLILGAGENRPPGEGHGLQRRNEKGVWEREKGVWELVPVGMGWPPCEGP